MGELLLSAHDFKLLLQIVSKDYVLFKIRAIRLILI